MSTATQTPTERTCRRLSNDQYVDLADLLRGSKEFFETRPSIGALGVWLQANPNWPHGEVSESTLRAVVDKYNLIPAEGTTAVDPTARSQVKLLAVAVFRVLNGCSTPSDFASVAELAGVLAEDKNNEAAPAKDD